MNPVEAEIIQQERKERMADFKTDDKEQKFSVFTVRDVLLAAKTVFHLYQNMSEQAWDERYGKGTSFEQALDQEFDQIAQSLPSARIERTPLLEIELMRATLDLLDEVEALRRGAAVTHVGADPVERLRFHTPSREFLDRTESAVRAADKEQFVPQPHRHPGPVAGCKQCEREAVTRYVGEKK